MTIKVLPNSSEGQRQVNAGWREDYQRIPVADLNRILQLAALMQKWPPASKRPRKNAGVYKWIMRHLALVIALVVSVTGISDSSAANPRPVKSLIELRRDNVVIQEWDLSCGAAALATILRYQYGDPVSEKDVAKALMMRKEYIENPELVKIRQGFSLLDLKRYVDGHGYRGIGYGKLTFADLVNKAPILAPVNFVGYNHFVIFRGVMKDRVLLADPAWGNRTMRRDDFESAWLDYGESMGRVGFVIEPREGKTAPPNQLSPRASDFFTLR